MRKNGLGFILLNRQFQCGFELTETEGCIHNLLAVGRFLVVIRLLAVHCQTAICRVQETEAKYYANGEDAFEMRKYFGSGAGKKKGGKKGGSSTADSSSSQQQQAAAIEAAAPEKQPASCS